MKAVLKYCTVILCLLAFNACIQDPCKETNCLNGGECLNGRCDCPAGLHGDQCQLVTLKLKSISHGSNNTYIYEYNADGNIAAVNHDSRSSSYEYKTDTIIEHYIFHGNSNVDYGHRIYTKFGNNRVKKENYTEGEASSRYSLYREYSPSCGYAREEFVDVETNEAVAVNLKYFLDEKCSYMNEYLFYSNSQKLSTTEVIYDNKNYFAMSLALPLFGPVNRGNIIKYSYKNSEGEIISAFSSKITYNERNYPIQEDRTYWNGVESTTYYEYYD